MKNMPLKMVALAAALLAGTAAWADEAAAKKWVDTEFQPSTLSKDEQMAEMKWQAPMVGGDATNNRDLVKLAGGHATGYYFLSPAMPSDLNTESGRALVSSQVFAIKAFSRIARQSSRPMMK